MTGNPVEKERKQTNKQTNKQINRIFPSLDPSSLASLDQETPSSSWRNLRLCAMAFLAARPARTCQDLQRYAKISKELLFCIDIIFYYTFCYGIGFIWRRGSEWKEGSPRLPFKELMEGGNRHQIRLSGVLLNLRVFLFAFGSFFFLLSSFFFSFFFFKVCVAPIPVL